MQDEVRYVKPISPHDALARERGVEWWGLLTFIFTEAIFFGSLITGYLYLRLQNAAQWVPPGAPPPDLTIALINTVLLVSSGFVAHWARNGIRHGNHRTLNVGLAVSIALGVAFLALQGWEYTHSGFSPQTGTYGSAFFTLTGFHGAHVTAGVIFLSILLLRSLRGSFNAEHNFGVEAGTLYWHFVDVVWIFLVALLYIW
jgi:cytochrome c oxidase subunit III